MRLLRDLPDLKEDLLTGKQNLSSLSPEAQEATQNAIFNSFRGANAKVVKPEQAVADVHITFSEDWQGYVWIATIQQGSSSQTVIRKLPHQQRERNRTKRHR